MRDLPRLLTCAVALVLVAACGGDTTHRASRAAVTPTPPPSAPLIDGRVIVLCGRDVFTQDLYDIRDGTITRRTTSATNNGVDNFAARGGRIALARVRDAIDHIELASLDAPTFDGRVIAPGTTPALDDDGTLAWSIVTERHGRLADAIHVKRPGRPARRVAVFPNVWRLEYVGGRLQAFVSGRGKYEEVRGVGAPNAKRTRLPLKRAAPVIWSHTGKLAYGNGRVRANEVRIHSANGRRVARHKTDWFPIAWSPDEQTLLVATAVRTPP